MMEKALPLIIILICIMSVSLFLGWTSHKMYERWDNQEEAMQAFDKRLTSVETYLNNVIQEARNAIDKRSTGDIDGNAARLPRDAEAGGGSN